MGYFLAFVFTILMLISGITFYSGFDLNNIDIINRIGKMIGGEPEVTNKGLIENNKLILKGTQNQVFFIKNKANIVIKTMKPDSYKNLMINFINTKNIGKEQETYQEGTDYHLYKCSDSNCRFEKNNDFIIYRLMNNTKDVERINEILVEAVNMQETNVSFLKEKADDTVEYNWTAKYILKTGDNNLKFPTVELQPNEQLYIKIKITNENLSI